MNRYSEILASAVKQSGWSLAEIALRCERHGVHIERTYLSKLCTGKKPPASDRINQALATVLSPMSSITYEHLRLAAYKEAIPEDVQLALIQEHLDGMRAET